MEDTQLEAILAAQEDDGWLVTEKPEAEPERLPEGGANETWLVHISSQMEPVYFKPLDGIDATTASLFGHTQRSATYVEAVAWRLAAAIGDPWATLATPCVLRELVIDRCARLGAMTVERFGERQHDVFRRAPRACVSAAFFDALIGNQDRRDANWKFDEDQGLGLFDHGFSFPAAREDITLKTELLAWRVDLNQPELLEDELNSVERLRESADLLGIAPMLDVDRRDRLCERVDHMATSGLVWLPSLLLP